MSASSELSVRKSGHMPRLRPSLALCGAIVMVAALIRPAWWLLQGLISWLPTKTVLLWLSIKVLTVILSTVLTTVVFALAAYTTGFVDELLRVYLAHKLSKGLGTAVTVHSLNTSIWTTADVTATDITVADFASLGGW
eukprot:9214-Heterococcus_DN1.PRE.1